MKVRSFEKKLYTKMPNIVTEKTHCICAFVFVVLLYLLLLIAMVGHLSCSKATLIEKVGLNSLFFPFLL
jgi:hypothetical protein